VLDSILIFIEFGQLILELLSREALKCGGIHSLSHAVKSIFASLTEHSSLQNGKKRFFRYLAVLFRKFCLEFFELLKKARVSLKIRP
jgi:hypothetical protein